MSGTCIFLEHFLRHFLLDSHSSALYLCQRFRSKDYTRFLFSSTFDDPALDNAALESACSHTCRTAELKNNTTIVVLGASGDLAKKKTVSKHPVLFTAIY
jgi:hypothetical protein